MYTYIVIHIYIYICACISIITCIYICTYLYIMRVCVFMLARMYVFTYVCKCVSLSIDMWTAYTNQPVCLKVKKCMRITPLSVSNVLRPLYIDQNVSWAFAVGFSLCPDEPIAPNKGHPGFDLEVWRRARRLFEQSFHWCLGPLCCPNVATCAARFLGCIAQKLPCFLRPRSLGLASGWTSRDAKARSREIRDCPAPSPRAIQRITTDKPCLGASKIEKSDLQRPKRNDSTCFVFEPEGIDTDKHAFVSWDMGFSPCSLQKASSVVQTMKKELVKLTRPCPGNWMLRIDASAKSSATAWA